MEKKKEYRLNDFYQAVVLKTLGLPLLRLERANGRFVTFVFADPKGQADELLHQYWDRGIKVIARDLIENINELKTRIYSKV